MTEKQGRNEIEYRLSLLKLNELLELKLITSEEYKKMQKKLIRKYKPVIGVLDV